MRKKSSPETILIITAILILLLIVIYLSSPCAGKHPDLLSAFSLGISILTLVFGYVIFDKFDSKKLSFNRKSSAVDDLFTEITNLRFHFIPCKKTDLGPENVLRGFSVRRSSFYLNRHNLGTKDIESLHGYPVYFTNKILDKINLLSRTLNNPWIPAKIGNKLKPIFIFSQTEPPKIVADESFVIVADFSEPLTEIEKYYKISYCVNENEVIEITDYKSLLDSFSGIMFEFETWYDENFDDSPDLQGDFNPRK